MTDQANMNNYYMQYQKQHPFESYDDLSPTSPLDEFEDLPSGKHSGSKLHQPLPLAQNHAYVSPMEITHPGSAGSLASSASNGSPSMFGSSFSPPSYAFSAPANFDPGFYMSGYQQPLSGNPTSPDMNGDDEYAVQLNMQSMLEKRRRRRESHNAVERRRRENINERIQELGTLLPETMMEELQATTNGSNNKPNKGSILRKTVDHIRQLTDERNEYQRRIKELEQHFNSLHRQIS